MCGLFAYAGSVNAVPILLDGLRSVEYRGYDSAGISIITESGSIETRKRGKTRRQNVTGELATLSDKFSSIYGEVQQASPQLELHGLSALQFFSRLLPSSPCLSFPLSLTLRRAALSRSA